MIQHSRDEAVLAPLFELSSIDEERHQHQLCHELEVSADCDCVVEVAQLQSLHNEPKQLQGSLLSVPLWCATPLAWPFRQPRTPQLPNQFNPLSAGQVVDPGVQ